MNKYIFFFLLFSAASFAEMCPCLGNFNVIHIGDSLAQVQKICCPPAEIKKYKKTPDVPQEWIYSMSVNANGAVQGSIKMSVLFVNGEVETISVGSLGSMSYTDLCSPNSDASHRIRKGDSSKAVEAACGKPLFVNPPQTPEATQNQNMPEAVELRYPQNNPPTALIFDEQGKLKEIKPLT
jgi:hypothetical protein